MQAQFVAAPPVNYQIYTRSTKPYPTWGKFALAAVGIAGATGIIMAGVGASKDNMPTMFTGVGLLGFAGLSLVASMFAMPDQELIIAPMNA